MWSCLLIYVYLNRRSCSCTILAIITSSFSPLQVSIFQGEKLWTSLTDPGAAAQQIDGNDILTRQIRFKCANGDIHGALCLLTTSDTVVTPTADVIAELWTKHLPAPTTEDLQQ